MKSKVLDWRKRLSWLGSIRHYAGHVLTLELRQHLSQERPQCWSDNLSWLPDYEYIFPEFLNSLISYYTHFKGFHGCRPLRVANYHEHGLLGQNSSILEGLFKEIFSDLPAQELEGVISQFERRGNQERGAIWLVGDDRYLVKECGHYLIQGSEYLMALAAHLDNPPDGEDYRFRLRNYGVPTILEVDIPVELVSPSQHAELAKMILSEWGQLASRRPLFFGDTPPCYVIRHDIPPEYIRGHYHPGLIIDPHQGHRLYSNPVSTCDVCG